MSNSQSDSDSESNTSSAKGSIGDEETKRRNELSRQLRRILDKVPAESVYDVLANSLLGGITDISLDALENIVVASGEQAEIFLDNPPPPSLDPFELTKEVSVLFEELHCLAADAAHAKESPWEDWVYLLEQVADSFVKWLRNIWLSVWEYRTSFERAQECLMVIQGYLETLTAARLGCICPFTTLPLDVTFHDLSGNEIQSWNTMSGTVLQEVVFWTWRELFMSILIQRRPHYHALIQKMIRDIEQSYGASHHIILFGGCRDAIGIDGNYNEEALDLADEDLEVCDDVFCDFIMESRSSHWEVVDEEFFQLKDILLEASRSFFVANPTYHGYLTLCSLDSCRGDLHQVLLDSAAVSRAAALCALTVFEQRHELHLIKTVLVTSAHVFETRDASSLRRAANYLLQHPETLEFGLHLVQQQLQDSLETIKVAFYATFKLECVPLALESLSQLSSLALRSVKRTEKAKAWVEDLLLPASIGTDAFSLAAMVLGLHPPMTDDAFTDDEEDEAEAARLAEITQAMEFDGLMGTLTVTCSRPHLPDLHELNRRYVVKRLLVWLSLVDSMPWVAKPVRYKTLLSLERAIYKELPWMRLPDVVSELKTKYSHSGKEGHLKLALETIQAFLEKRKAHHNRVRAAQKKAAEAAKSSQTASAPAPGPTPISPMMDDVN